MLPNDTWVLIGLHLKPRHLAKLMATSKTIKRLVDNENYWNRVASQIVWRTCELMEMYHAYTPETNRLPRINHNLYFMVGLDLGYYWGMERFFQRMEEVIEYYSSSTDIDDAKNKQWCIKLKPMAMPERTREWMRVGLEPPLYRPEEELQMSMKEVAKMETKNSLRNCLDEEYSPCDAKMNAFLCDMEDNPMPHAHKRIMLERLKKLLYDVKAAEDGCSPTTIACGVCKF